MQLWRARSAIDAAASAAIKLDDARRAVDAMAVSWRPVPPDALHGTMDVNQAAVASLLGVSPAPSVVSSALMDGSAVAEPLSLILSLPKGKRLLVRCVPNLSQRALVDACVAGIRLLPHFVVRRVDWIGAGLHVCAYAVAELVDSGDEGTRSGFGAWLIVWTAVWWERVSLP